MARKRLSPAALTALSDRRAPEMKSDRPPISSIVADAAGRDALMEAAHAHKAARDEGRLIVDLPLAAVEARYLVRDRLAADGEEMATLRASIEARGQQTPVEVEDLGNGRYGLISGWRRLEALRAIGAGTVKALVRTPATASDAYVAMVEENEIRAALSFYERARVAALAAERGVFPTAEIAVRQLFRHASRPKRSKILSFLRLYRALDDALRFPAALSERQGLALAKALEAGQGAEVRLRAALTEVAPETAEAERAALAAALRPARKPQAPTERDAPSGIRLFAEKGRVELTGAAVDEAFVADLRAWLARRPVP